MRILLGESRKQIGQQLQQRLRANCEIDTAKDVPSLNNQMLSRAYALIILALDVPTEDKLKLVEQCRQVSEKSAIMLVSDPLPVSERVMYLEAGVDDYMMLPIHYDEFAARAKVLIRRSDMTKFSKIRVGNVEISDDGGVLLDGERVDLHQAELNLLSVLVRRSGRVVSKSMIDLAVTGGDSEELSSNAIEQRISRLRRILDHANSSVQITTIRGSGYLLEASNGVHRVSRRQSNVTDVAPPRPDRKQV